ncbi:hypothetical protein [Flavobacterium sp.]|uniref:hypothetical protein n=1 Tax=Flavobacterium sp. TaxID=239 RepID=UPI00286F7718|nr:hypothetical protein [Flavobacterium sp.]
MILIASYIIIFLTQVLSFTFIPISLIGEILKKLKIPLQIGIFIGGLFTWFFMNIIWLNVNNHNISLLAFVICWFIKIYKSLENNNIDTKTNNLMLKSEASCIVIIALYVFIFKEFNWY